MISDMKIKITAVCVLLWVFAGCGTFGGNADNKAKAPAQKDEKNQAKQNTSNHQISIPESGSLVFIGVSGRQSRAEQEIETAREDAAKKVAMYYGLEANVVIAQSIGSNALDYYTISSFQMEPDTQFEQYLEQLTYNPERDVTRGDGVIYIRFSYPATFPGNIDYKSTKERDGTPGWVKKPPYEINGYTVQVGFARRHERIRDTITKSAEDAEAAHISHASSSFNTRVASVNDVNTTVVAQQSHGRLSQFLILETWMNPKDLSVWTLTIAKSVN